MEWVVLLHNKYYYCHLSYNCNYFSLGNVALKKNPEAIIIVLDLFLQLHKMCFTLQQKSFNINDEEEEGEEKIYLLH